jgi:hypothetical protein
MRTRAGHREQGEEWEMRERVATVLLLSSVCLSCL